MTRKDILKHNGKISHEEALKKAHQEYDKYIEKHLTTAEKDYLEALNQKIENINKKRSNIIIAPFQLAPII